MKSYDWIVIGAGITGAALAYELILKSFSVLLIEQNPTPNNATRYSYGGLAFWSGTTPLTRKLCQEGITRQQILPVELDADTEFRELDLLLTIATDSSPEAVAIAYNHFSTPPELLSVKQACELEPLLNPDSIAGALTIKHGHIHPEKTVQAYIQAFLRAGGEIEIAEVLQLQAGRTAVKTSTQTYHSAKVVVCTGGLSRQLLKASGIPVKVYFTHAEMIQTPPQEVRLNTLVMPAELKRFQLEASASKNDQLWNEPSNDLGYILDAGAVQFQDGSFRIGQITYVMTDPYFQRNSDVSQLSLQTSIGKILPALANLPGTKYHCLVAFSKDSLPLIGAIEGCDLYIFSGFSNPLVIVPPLAKRFANWISDQEDEIIPQLSPARFSSV